MKRYGRRAKKKRRGKRRMPKYKQPLRSQRYAKARIDQVIPLTGTNLIQANAIGFAWMQREALISNVYGHNACARYQSLVRDYEQYAITGIKVHWIPSNIRGQIAADNSQAVGGFIGPMYVYDDINSYNVLNLTPQQLLVKDNIMIRDPTR